MAYSTAGTLDFSVQLIDLCGTPSISVPAQTDPSDYLYTLNSPAASFVMVPFVVNPSSCSIVYSCAVTSGPRSGLCSISDGSTIGTFASSTGDYSFESYDVPNYPEGPYVFQITGTTGSNLDVTDTTTFTLNLINPCTSATLSLNPTPFTD